MSAPDEEGQLFGTSRGPTREGVVGLERNAEHDLAHSLALVRATLEATADAILVTDENGHITDFNERYPQLFHIDRALLAQREHRPILQALSKQFADPDAFMRRVAEIYAAQDRESFDILELIDGRVIERISKAQIVNGRNAGRVWSFRDVSERVRTQAFLEEQRRTLEVLNETGTMIASELDIEVLVQTVTDAARQLIGAQFGAFFYNYSAGEQCAFRLFTLSGAPREAFDHLPMPRATSIFGPTFRGEGIVRSDDIQKHPDYGKSEPYRGMPPGHLPVRSYIAVPVISRNGYVHGGLFFGHPEPGKFTVQHEQLLKGMAAQTAVAIDNVRLFETAQRSQLELKQLNEELERKIAERTAALKRSELQFEQLVTGITDCALYMLDPRGYITSWNPGAERIKGYTAQEIIGRHFSTFYTEEDRANGVPQRALATAEREGKYESEAWRVRKDGTRFWASVLVDAIRTSDGKLLGFAKITRDMTEKRAMQEQLHQAQKMEAIGQLTGGVAHDFNNLLTVILGNLDLIWRRAPKDDDRLLRAVDQATKGAERAAALTQQLLAFARRQPLNPKPTDVNRLVLNMSDLIRRTLAENIAIETVLAAGLWRVDVDPHQLESALLNLAVNARDAMPQGGTLLLETSNVEITAASAMPDIQPGAYVMISISDTGIGMSEEVIAHAFDPFFTTKPIGQGTGLGLSQVFGFVKQSGGHVHLDSEVGEGTTVTIYLPRLLGDVPLTEPEPDHRAARGKPTETILVVEDDEDVRMYTTESLREFGFSVLEAHDSSSALRILQEHPEIALLFTDVGLPGLNGRELLDAARRIRPKLPVLFTSGYARDAIVHAGRLDAGIDLLNKPFTRDELAARIRAALDAAEASARPQRTALIVEDEPLVRMFLADALSMRGYCVAEASDAKEGLEAARAIANIEVAFVDVGLPDRSGLELADELHRLQPDMNVVIASGYGDLARGRLREDSKIAFLKKPFHEGEVTALLDRLAKQSIKAQ